MNKQLVYLLSGFVIFSFTTLTGCGVGQSTINRTNAKSISSANSTSSIKQKDEFGLNGLSVPKINPSTSKAVLEALNQYLEKKNNESNYKPLELSNIKIGPSSKSPYASLIANKYGENAIKYSMWVAAGQPGVPYNKFAKNRPSLIINYYFVEKNGTWKLWHIN